MPLPTLTRALAESPAVQARADLTPPGPELLALPETVVQFGTGAFLRGFVDHFVDAANRAGTFGGRVVAVGSTASGRDRAIGAQDGLYTLVSRGIVRGDDGAEGGVRVDERRIVASVSRALSAATEWDDVLACARDPRLALVFSNTTEIGITLDEGDRFDLAPPRSFPGKLTRFLYERARAFDFAPSCGLVVLPCELIEENGDRLRDIVLALAARWELDVRFAAWVAADVRFCNTLVDRIVPGEPPGVARAELEADLGYRDALLTTCEPYRLFAIEGDPSRLAGRDAVLARLADADAGIVIAPDIAPYRERKVRLLNGAHTVMVWAALLAGCETVRDAVEHDLVGRFVRAALLDEIVPTVDAPGAPEFAREVLARFANPFVRHALWDITLQGTMKMRVRVVPTLQRYAAARGHAPPSLAFGFAAYLLAMRGELHERRHAAGLPVPADDRAARVRALWDGGDAGDVAGAACAEVGLWGVDLSSLPGFREAVADHLARLDADLRRAFEALLTAPPARP